MAGGVQVVADVEKRWCGVVVDIVVTEVINKTMKQIFKKNTEVRHGVFELVPAGAVAAADSDVKKC